MATIDVAPTIIERNDTHKQLAEKISYPEVTLDPKVDIIILQEVSTIVGHALTAYSESKAVTTSPDSDIREYVELFTDETKLDRLLAPVILSSGRSSYMQDHLIDQANELFYMALGNATDVAVDAFKAAQTAKFQGKFREYEKQGEVISMFSCELNEWVAPNVSVSSKTSSIGKTAASAAFAASVGIGLINAAPAVAEGVKKDHPVHNNHAAVVQVIGNTVSQQSIITVSEVSTTDDVADVELLDSEPIINFDEITDIAKGSDIKVKDENKAINPITLKPVSSVNDDISSSVDTATRKENNTEAREVEKSLSSNVAEAMGRLRAAVNKKSLNELSISEGDIFSVNDPYNKKKQLAMPMDSETLLNLKTKSDVLNAVLANDQEVIAIFLKYYEENPPTDEMLEIIKEASVVSFSDEEAQDLTDEQKLVMLFMLHDLQTEMLHEADATYKKRLKSYEAEQRAEQKNSVNNSPNYTYSSKVVKKEVRKLTRLSREKQDNIAKLIIAGENLMVKENIDEDIIIGVIGQGILESGYLDSALASAPHYNIFGVKAGKSWKGKKVLMPTHEYVNGKRVATMAYFRSYGSLEAALEDRIMSLGNLDFYKDASRCATSPKKYLQGLMYKLDANCDVTDKFEPRYATADQEDYVNNILSVIKSTKIENIIEKSYVKKPEIIKRAKDNKFVRILPDGSTHMSQNDELTGNKAYPKSSGEYKTMAQSGCSPTAWADALYYTGVDENATPLSVAELFLENGGRDSSLDAAKTIEKKYGVNVVNISNLSADNQIEKIKRALKINPATGKPYGAVIASGQDGSIYDEAPYTTGGHVIGIKKIQANGSVKVMDPQSIKNSKKWWSENQIIERSNYVYIMYLK